MIRRRSLLLLCFSLLLTGAVGAQERDPKLPAGRDPGGLAVALVTTGLDYTVPEIASRLARDGEGELIGWDFVDNDNRPFAQTPQSPSGPAREGTGIALRLLEVYARIRLVPVRVDPAEPVAFARAVAFVARTPARIIAIPFSSSTRAEWEPFRQAAERFGKDLLFVLSAGDAAQRKGAEVWPAMFALPNAFVVAPAPSTDDGPIPVDAWIMTGGSSVLGHPDHTPGSAAEAVAVALAAGLAACAQHKGPATDAVAARSALLAIGRPAEGAPGAIFDPVCPHGGQRN